MMCEDEKSYAAYLAYLDAIQKSGKEGSNANPDEAKDEAMNHVMKAMEDAARERWNRDPWAEDAANDKTLSVHSPFVCTPVEK
jgi:hypothetical protein